MREWSLQGREVVCEREREGGALLDESEGFGKISESSHLTGIKCDEIVPGGAPRTGR